MHYIVTGGSGSGKSAFGERLAIQQNRNPFYIATMECRDEESRLRIERHRLQRQDKGFITIEQPLGLESLLWEKNLENSVLLLEDLSNLLANEMYETEGRIKGQGSEAVDQTQNYILEPLLALEKKAGCVIIVTNEVFSDSVAYHKETQRFLRLLAYLNCSLSETAEDVIEVVCGIPLGQKGSKAWVH